MRRRSKAAMAGKWQSHFEWNAPDWKNINNPDTSAVGFNKGKALSADASAAVDKFVTELAGGLKLWKGPLALQDGSTVPGRGRGGHRPAGLVPAPAPAGHAGTERLQVTGFSNTARRGENVVVSPLSFENPMQIELRDIRKTFGSVHANAGISLLIPPASIQGILGENGAGQEHAHEDPVRVSSCRTAGDILLDGKRSRHPFPGGRDPARHRDAPPGSTGFSADEDPGQFHPRAGADRCSRIDGRRRASSATLAAQFDFSLDADACVDTLTVGERQQLEILRLLWFGARVLILDEPTTGISQPQKEKLFATLRSSRPRA